MYKHLHKQLNLLFALEGLKKKVKIYYASQKADGKNYNTAHHLASIEASGHFCRCVLNGILYVLKENKDSIKGMFRYLNSQGIITSRTTFMRIRNKSYTHLNTLIISYMAVYTNKSIIDLYIIGEKIYNKELVLKGCKSY